jgi:iron complex transport system substrate-binding protein
MGTPQRGDDVITKMRTEIEAIRQQADSGSRPTVFCEEWGKPLIASQIWVAELAEAAGGCFVGQPGLKTSINEIGSLNPDVLIASWCGAGNRVPLEKIIRDRHWEDLRAAQTGRVYCIPDDFLNTPAPTLVHGLHALAAAIHPERFPAVPRVRRIESAAVPAEAKVSA